MTYGQCPVFTGTFWPASRNRSVDKGCTRPLHPLIPVEGTFEVRDETTPSRVWLAYEWKQTQWKCNFIRRPPRTRDILNSSFDWVEEHAMVACCNRCSPSLREESVSFLGWPGGIVWIFPAHWPEGLERMGLFVSVLGYTRCFVWYRVKY